MGRERVGGRLLIFGGGGFVGGNLSAVARERGWEAHIADRGSGRAIPGASWRALDVTRAAAVRRLVPELSPDAAASACAEAAAADELRTPIDVLTLASCLLDADAEPGGRAPRHKRGVISVAKARGLLSTPLLTAERSIRLAIEERL